MNSPGPMPTPTAEEPELFPGGADAIEDHVTEQSRSRPLGADIPPHEEPSRGLRARRGQRTR